MDEMLEERFGEKISSFVEKHGWPAFRDEEEMLADELSRLKGVVIDCGGGVVTREINIHRLRENGFVVWLQTPPEVISKRIGGDKNRPSLTGAKTSTDEIEEVLRERIPMYQAASDMTIDTSAVSVEEAAILILNAWRTRLETLETS